MSEDEPSKNDLLCACAGVRVSSCDEGERGAGRYGGTGKMRFERSRWLVDYRNKAGELNCCEMLIWRGWWLRARSSRVRVRVRENTSSRRVTNETIYASAGPPRISPNSEIIPVSTFRRRKNNLPSAPPPLDTHRRIRCTHRLRSK